MSSASPSTGRRTLPIREFIALMAVLVSIVALSTDIMLPGMSRIGAELDVAHPNDVQLSVSMLFAGLVIGQLFAGPLSDRFGRRPAMHAGFAIFVLGCVLSAFATSFTVLLIGRVLQGVGASAPRIVTLAIVRDGHSGRAMARIMSIVMAIFIFVPTVAPAVGQLVMLAGGWRATFVALLVFALLGWSWFAIRQPETLAIGDRRSLSMSALRQGLGQFIGNRTATGYTLAIGCTFGAFLGYLGSAQQVFQQTYGAGSRFALWFGIAALSIGAASLLNARLVNRFGMRAMAGLALVGMASASSLFLIVTIASGGVPPFALFMPWLLVVLGGMGLLFGNLNALAMEPLGRMAGLGAALVGSASTLLSLPFGWLVGRGYDGGVTALVAGFTVLPTLAFVIVCVTERALPWRAAAGDRVHA